MWVDSASSLFHVLNLDFLSGFLAHDCYFLLNPFDGTGSSQDFFYASAVRLRFHSHAIMCVPCNWNPYLSFKLLDVGKDAPDIAGLFSCCVWPLPWDPSVLYVLYLIPLI